MKTCSQPILKMLQIFLTIRKSAIIHRLSVQTVQKRFFQLFNKYACYLQIECRCEESIAEEKRRSREAIARVERDRDTQLVAITDRLSAAESEASELKQEVRENCLISSAWNYLPYKACLDKGLFSEFGNPSTQAILLVLWVTVLFAQDPAESVKTGNETQRGWPNQAWTKG